MYMLSSIFVWLLGFLARCLAFEFKSGLFTLILLGIPLFLIAYSGFRIFVKSVSVPPNKRDVSRNELPLWIALILGILSGVIIESRVHKIWRSHLIINRHEASTIGILKRTGDCESDYNDNSYPHTYATLSEMCNEFGKPQMEPSYFNMNLCSGEVSGYKFDLQLGNNADEYGGIWSWSATAWPVIYGETGIRSFYIDENRVVRGSDVQGKPGNIDLPQVESLR